MSLQTDAETIRALSEKISSFEVAKTFANAPGAVITLLTVKITKPDGSFMVFDLNEMNIVMSAAQKTAAFAQESSWQSTIKTLSQGW